MSFNQKGQTKKLLKFLKRIENPCCDCPDVSSDDGNSIECRDDGLYAPGAGGDASASTTSQSKYLLSEDDVIFTINGPKLRDINYKSLISLYKMPMGNFTSNIDPMTKSGSMTTATIALTNAGFDNVIVAGSTEASYIRFPFIATNNRVVYRLKLRVDAVGATAPIVGFRNIWPGATYSNFNNPQFHGYFNLATGTVTTTTSGVTTTSDYNGFAGTVSAGNIIELELQFEQMRPRIFTVTKNSLLTGEFSVRNQLKNTTADGDWSLINHPAIILADGTYTILDYEILSFDDRPTVLIDGDSMGVGVRISHNDTITGKLESKIPYRVASIAAGSKRLAGHLATMWQIRRLKPTYVLFFHYIESCQGLANPANGGHATWSANFAKYVSTIKALGITPIFVHPQTWAVIDPSGTNSAFYETYLNTNYPNDMKIKVLTSESFYDSTGFHYNGVTNGIITDKLITLLDSVL